MLRALAIFILAVSLETRLSAQLPPRPILVGHSATNFGGYALAVAVSGRHAYLANGNDGLRIFDISNPARPVAVGHAPDSGYFGAAVGIAISGSYAYVANGATMRIYNVSLPILPVLVSEVPVVGESGVHTLCHDVIVSDNRVYLACDFLGIFIYDITNPRHPIYLRSAPPGTGEYGPAAYGVALSGEYLYVADYFAGLDTYHFTGGIPKLESSLQVGFGGLLPLAYGVSVSGRHACVACGDDGLHICDLSDPAQPKTVGHVNNGGNASCVKMSGRYAYLANDDDGLRIYDVSDPALPSNVSHVNDGGHARGLAVVGNYVSGAGNYAYLYLANGEDGLRIYRLEPNVPTLLHPAALASVGPAAPTLSISRIDNGTVQLSWPATASGYVLQECANAGSTGWTTITNAPIVVSGENQVTLSTSTGSRFYRLKLP